MDEGGGGGNVTSPKIMLEETSPTSCISTFIEGWFEKKS
jgi:hypothetical protein